MKCLRLTSVQTIQLFMVVHVDIGNHEILFLADEDETLIMTMKI